jgi:hypothetical protein
MRHALLVAGCLWTAPAAAGDWFLHEFGELRARFGDWLAVCEDSGDGSCRAVQTFRDPGSAAFFDGRPAVIRNDGAPGWVFEAMDRGLDNTAVSEVGLSVDGHAMPLPTEGWSRSRDPSAPPRDSVVIADPTATDAAIALIQPGSRLTFTYAPAGSGDGVAVFSLRGVTAALNAVDARVRVRQE